MKSLNLVLSCLLLLLSSCGSDDQKGKTEAERLFKEAKQLVKSERFILATEKLNQLKTQHPYSFYATPAELLLAEVQFLQENYIEAAASFMLFRDFHPKHERIPWVIFMTGESYFKQLPSTIDRDLEAGTEALKYYEELISKYPDDSHVKESRKRVSTINLMLREKDQYIADFYFKTGEWEAARWWYRDIFKKYPNVKALREHVMVRLVASSCQMKDWDVGLQYAKKFREQVDKGNLKELRSWEVDCKRHKVR